MKPAATISTTASSTQDGGGGSSTFAKAPPRRISPAPTTLGKRHQQQHGGVDNNNSNHNHNKRRKFRSEPMDVDPLFPKLDQSNPVHAKRIQTRRRTVAMGKNTAGYSEYIDKVPKNERRQRSMDTPSTPDHTLDIPTKRWQGVVKAWRKALHKFDPPDLATAFQAAGNSAQPQIMPKDNNNNKGNNKQNVQERQIEESRAMGLLVNFSPPSKESSSDQASAVARDGSCSPISVLTEESTKSGNQNLMDLEDWTMGKSTSNDDDDAIVEDGDDSDDDLL